MTRWFRFYDDALNDPKILKLSDSLYRAWSGLLCVASKNDGLLPPVDDLAIMLRSDVSSVKKNIAALIAAGLLDDGRGGRLTPHNWRKRQYKSDVSTDRVKRFRKRFNAVSETPPDTEQTQSRTDTDSSKKNIVLNGGSGKPAKQKPRHGRKTKDGRRLWLDCNTIEWNEYAKDYREAHSGVDPPVQWDGAGTWFNLSGEH